MRDPRSSLRSPRTIPALVERAAAEFGDREALVDGDLRWTFSELGAQVYRCAGAMLAAGIEPGDRVAVWAPNGHRFVVAALGAVTAGAILVPVNTRFKGDEAAWILGKSRARLLLVENGFLGNDYVAMLRQAGWGQAAPEPPATVIMPGEDWEGFLATGVGADARARAGRVSEDDIADMFFTSGTTGRPKGVLAAHGQNIRVFEAWADGVGLQSGDRYLIVNPMFHTFGYKAGVLACLLRGATMVSQPVFDVTRTLELIEAEKISVLPGPPTLYASILDHPAARDANLESLRLAVTGAAVVPVRLIERMQTELFKQVVIAYGLTESCGTVTVGDPRTNPELMSRTVGVAIEGTEVRTAGTGEVLVRGYNVMRGYFEDPEATAAAIDEDGWLHTGDVGSLDADGNLRITDRLKDMYITGGFNVYPAEVEQTIARHPAVSEAAVVGVPDPDERLGEVGLAYVILRPGQTATETEIIGFCRERMANFKVPRAVRVVRELPRNASGKVLKYQLRSRPGRPT
ncbi:MAG: AMP-binding protein [Streptosporangiaceae bacterium]|nr:AMP-binding protein [Streptosporangiaceae bacterium]